MVDLGRRRRPERRVARYAWPAAVGAAGLAWYGADSLRHRRESGHGYDLAGRCDVRDESFLRAAEALTGAPLSWGNDIELLINGDRIFPCYLQDDPRGAGVASACSPTSTGGARSPTTSPTRCASGRDAGVECNVLIDAVGGGSSSATCSSGWRRRACASAASGRSRPYAAKRLGNRTHRKILVADGRVGLTGGVGIAEEWTGNAEDPDHWRDTHVRVEGPVVRGLFGAFAENWLEATGEVLVGERYLPGARGARRRRADDGRAVERGRRRLQLEALYYLAIAAARESLDLTAAYFVPRPAFIEALQDAAERGVRTRVLVPGANIDKTPVWLAGRASYDEL